MVYITKGTCATAITIDVEDGIIKSVSFHAGCNGNTEGISRLVTGMEVDEVIKPLEGIICGKKDTSCPDQLAKALRVTQTHKNECVL